MGAAAVIESLSVVCLDRSPAVLGDIAAGDTDALIYRTRASCSGRSAGLPSCPLLSAIPSKKRHHD
jgi:hypothetical protein